MAGRAEASRSCRCKTSGDRIQDRPLAEVGGKALWTKELDLALLAGETDCSVHSMKDVESERPDDAGDRRDAAARRRSRPADRGELDRRAAAGRGGRHQLAAPRRAVQRLRPDLRTVSIRGNVDTRLAKLEAGEVDATLLAAAGLDRLGADEVGAPIDRSKMLPAPAQGAIGIECRADDACTVALLRPSTMSKRIRRFCCRAGIHLRLGGTCHSPIAARRGRWR